MGEDVEAAAPALVSRERFTIQTVLYLVPMLAIMTVSMWLALVGVQDMRLYGFRIVLLLAVLAWTGLSLFGAGAAIVLLNRTLSRSERLRIDGEGVRLAMSGGATIPWSEIRRIELWTIRVGYGGISIPQQLLTVVTDALLEAERTRRPGGLSGARLLWRRNQIEDAREHTTEVFSRGMRPGPDAVAAYLEEHRPGVLVDRRSGRLVESAVVNGVIAAGERYLGARAGGPGAGADTHGGRGCAQAAPGSVPGPRPAVPEGGAAPLERD